MIKAIDRAAVQKICSGQVVVDLCSAVKELVENAVDAGADSIEVTLREMGADRIEVTDNGRGIDARDYAEVALKHHTSKIAAFADLEAVSSFGFRGEALNALCELSEGFTISTKTETEDCGTLLSFARNGRLSGQESVARTRGSTVTVDKLFAALPVRRREFVRSIKKQFQKMLRAVQSYAIICKNTKIRIININSSSRSVALATQGGASMAENISTVFGAKFFATLVNIQLECAIIAAKSDAPVTVHGDDSLTTFDASQSDKALSPADTADTSDAAGAAGNRADDGNWAISRRSGDIGLVPAADNNSNTWTTTLSAPLPAPTPTPIARLTAASLSASPSDGSASVRIEGYVSQAGRGVGRSDSDRQFIFCNGRPVDAPKFVKLLNEVWRKYEMKHRPAFFLSLSLPAGCLDVNLTPDKREVVILHQEAILSSLRKAVDAIYEPSRCTLIVAAAAGSSSSSSSQQTQTQTQRPPLAFAGFAGFGGFGVSNRRGVGGVNGLDISGGAPDGGTSTGSCIGRGKEGGERGAGDEVSPDSIVASLQMGDAQRQGDSQASACLEFGAGSRSGAGLDAWAFGSGKRKFESERDSDPMAADSTQPGAADAADAAALGVGETSSSRNSSQAQEQPYRAREEGNALQVEGREQERKHAVLVEEVSGDWSFEAVAATRRARMRLKQRKQENSVTKRAPFQGVLDESELADGGKHYQKRGEKAEVDKENVAAVRSGPQVASLETDRSVRVLEKQDFGRMRVVGQFNLGFVVAELRGDLFILDQHACDEKYRFEQLQRTTKLHQQPLIRPLPLECTASEELTILDHLPAFQANGFQLQVLPENPAGCKIRLLAVPFSRGTQFGQEDVHELASILAGADDLFSSSSSTGASGGGGGGVDSRVDKMYLMLKNEPLLPQSAAERIHTIDTTASTGAEPGAVASGDVCDASEKDPAAEVEEGWTGTSVGKAAAAAGRGGGAGGGGVRLPKLVALYASRACRSAVMIGTALSDSEMTRVVRRLQEVEQPWNCPHGRPTVRHLHTLTHSHTRRNSNNTETSL